MGQQLPPRCAAAARVVLEVRAEGRVKRRGGKIAAGERQSWRLPGV